MGRTKAKLRNGEPVRGGWIMIGHPTVAELMAAEGFDFIGVDLEHTTIGIEGFHRCALAVKGTDVDLLARLPANDPVIANNNAAVKNLTINLGAILDLTSRELTVEGTLTNDGTLVQTQNASLGATAQYLEITNKAGTQTKHSGVGITPAGNPAEYVPCKVICAQPEPGRRRRQAVRQKRFIHSIWSQKIGKNAD